MLIGVTKNTMLRARWVQGREKAWGHFSKPFVATLLAASTQRSVSEGLSHEEGACSSSVVALMVMQPGSNYFASY